MRLATFASLALAALFVADAGAQTRVVQVAAGMWTTCAVTDSGAVLCWGGNFAGQLGDGTLVDRPVPGPVLGLESGVASVDVSQSAACAVTNAGGLKCWGRNTNGELGDGTTVNRLTPADVVGLGTGVRSVSITAGHACAVLVDGKVKCWGDNRLGGLGDGTTTNRLTPVDVVGLSGKAISVGAGGAHSCALLEGGAVECWGDRAFGALGDGLLGGAPSTQPVRAQGLDQGVVALDVAGFSSCALKADGNVLCWGENRGGQLGVGAGDRAVPTPVIGLSGPAKALGTGGVSCAVVGRGAPSCWGIFLPSLTVWPTARDVVGIAAPLAAVAGAVGGTHACGITVLGGLYCWGTNDHGQLGDGSIAPTRFEPLPVSGLGGAQTGHYGGMWWKDPGGSESGWGLNVAHQGDTIFATWFTYGADGKGQWLILPAPKTGPGQYTGPLYRTTGPAFDTASWNSADVRVIEAGSATLTFVDDNTARSPTRSTTSRSRRRSAGKSSRHRSSSARSVAPRDPKRSTRTCGGRLPRDPSRDGA